MQVFFAQLLNKTLNTYIRLDPESRQRLQDLEGRVVKLEIIGVPITLQLQFCQGEVLITYRDFISPHTSIRGTPLSLFRMAAFKEDRRSAFSDDLSIDGDLDLAQKVMALFDQLEIDWEEWTSRWVGDVAAHQLGRFARRIQSFNQHMNETMIQNINEYVHEEIELFPSKEETEDFFNEVDELRMDVDRLEMRINRVKQGCMA